MPGHALSVDDAERSLLHGEVARLDALAERRLRLLRVFGVAGGALLVVGICVGAGVTQLRQQLSSCRARLVESRQESSALAAAEGSARRMVTGASVAPVDSTPSGT